MSKHWNKNLVLSNELIKVELPPWKIWKAWTFWKRQLSKSFTVVIRPLSTRLIKPNFCFTLPPTQHHSFFRNWKLVNTETLQGGFSFTHGYCLLRYLEWAEKFICFTSYYSNIPWYLPIWFQLKANGQSLGFMRGTFHSTSHVLTGFNNRPMASSLSALYY